jgi:glutamate-1-semialdehyde 2,1-aminomutase
MATDRYKIKYTTKTTRSAELHERAKQVIPGGDTRNATHHHPYPSFISDASGTRLSTIDDTELVDFLNNYTVNIHGHAFEPVVDAICTRYKSGNSPGGPVEEFVSLAECLVQRTASVEKIRFCNSGTEATMHAIRGAMAYSGNELVLKVNGGYHGSHDTVQVDVHGSGLENPGIPTDVLDRVKTVRYNDVSALEEIFEQYGDDLACFIIEPIMGAGGMVPATQEYLSTARDLTEETETPLIFDEVITYRLAEGGAQELYGVRPDITTFGKIIGGGLPVGAFGGHAEMMSVFHPTDGIVSQSGTFSGNPATMAGGLESLNHYGQSSIERLNKLGDSLRNALSEVAREADIPISVTGVGSLFHIHFTDNPVVDAGSSTAGCDKAKELFLAMRDQGVYISPRGMGCLSTPMTNSDIELFVEAFRESIQNIERI